MSVQGASFPIVDQEASTTGSLTFTLNGDIYIGQNTGTTQDGSNNTIVGNEAGTGITSSAAGNSILGAGVGPTMDGVNNSYIGYSCARNALYSVNNVAIGALAADGFTQGSNNVFVGASTARYIDVRHPYVLRGTCLGDGARIAGCNCVSLGASAIASGLENVAIGSGVSAVSGNGGFSIMDRLVGAYVTSHPNGMDTYATQVRCDMLQMPRGSAVGFMNETSLNALSTDASWMLQLDGDDLVFKSKNGTRIRLVDDFYAGVLDYTAQHHCCFDASDKDRVEDSIGWKGRVVVASGGYVRGAPGIGDAVPTVELSTRDHDPRVLGVIDHVTRDRGSRIGHFKFEKCFKGDGEGWMVVVNSSGDGGILVSDENGPISNGDLLVTSSLLPGIAMRQSDLSYTSATVAKATCDCDFSDDGSPNEVTIMHTARGIKAQRVCLIGCIYKC